MAEFDCRLLITDYFALAQFIKSYDSEVPLLIIAIVIYSATLFNFTMAIQRLTFITIFGKSGFNLKTNTFLYIYYIIRE